ncbi:MAG: type II toxin-antitoxin system VapC family toxin [Chloroflexi bacterium]|nr:type II toxin-antitoxin system VapC family toxin [Chloroflexota bacterium]MYK34469.1 type II toxin-antitoxin system VapC family toxin [Chloroflexota bacterium]
MTTVFVDTAYLIARARPDDQWRDAAVAARNSLGAVSLVTTDEVLTEFLTAMSRAGPGLRVAAAGTVREILQAGAIRVVAQTHRSFLDGLGRYEERVDKGYSLQDCVSMNVMEAEGITEILTSDRHFEQEGFTVLMKQGR